MRDKPFGRQDVWATDVWATRRLGDRRLADILGNTIFILSALLSPLATGGDTIRKVTVSIGRVVETDVHWKCIVIKAYTLVQFKK